MIRVLAFASVLALTACGEDKNSDAYSGPGVKSDGSSFAGLLFAVVDKDFTSSQILYNEFSTGDVNTISTGESGDPFVRWLGSKVYLFNRSQTSLNFRTFDPRGETQVLTPQKATAQAGIGDPHDAVLLAGDRMLLALYSAGKLVVVHPTTGDEIQTIDADWDLGAESQLRPEAFQVLAGDGGNILVMHQGLDKSFQPDGTQQVFVLHDDGQTLAVVDQDDSKAKIQGIALPVTSPSGFYTGSDGSILTYGECNMYSADTCKAGFVKIDVANKKSEIVYDTSGLIGNGGITKGEGDTFYALVAKGKEETSAKVITKIDLTAKGVSDIYTFQGSRGCCSLTYDESTKTLFTGDVSSKDPNAGVLLAFVNGATTPTEAALPGNPYGGQLVPK